MVDHVTLWFQRENGYFASFDTTECVKPCYYDGKHDHLKIVPIFATIFDPGLNSPECLYRVPFAALLDEDGKYLSETFRIRIVPSLTILKSIHDGPAHYHCKSGAPIVGDPDVGRVRYSGGRKTFTPFPYARKEAAMIGRLLGVQPLLGEQATKQAVLQRLPTLDLIHFAAHGSAERGEVALSAVGSTNKFPKEDEYLFTMSDI